MLWYGSLNSKSSCADTTILKPWDKNKTKLGNNVGLNGDNASKTKEAQQQKLKNPTPNTTLSTIFSTVHKTCVGEAKAIITIFESQLQTQSIEELKGSHMWVQKCMNEFTEAGDELEQIVVL